MDRTTTVLTDRNKTMRNKAHKQLDELIDLSIARGAYGEYGVRVVVTDGSIKAVRRVFDGEDRACDKDN